MADYTIPSYIDKRLRYFYGLFLQEQDFIDEQKYHIGRQRRHVKGLHLAGIVDGLTVSISGSLQVAPGSALDDLGREIVLSEARIIETPPALHGKSAYLIARYDEMETQPRDSNVAGAGGATSQPSFFHERPDIQLIEQTALPSNPHAVLLATVAVGAGGALTAGSIDYSIRIYSGICLPGAGNNGTWPSMRWKASKLAQLKGSVEVDGDISVGAVIAGLAGSTGDLGYGNRLSFNGNKENSDPLWIARYNEASDKTRLRINIGDNNDGNDMLDVGVTSGAGAWTSALCVRNNGNLSITGICTILGDGVYNNNGNRIVQCNASDWLRINPDLKFPAIALVNATAIGNAGLAIGEWTQQPAGRLKATENVYAAGFGNISGGALRVLTTSGYLDIGPQNTGWSHFNTDRPMYYFDKEIRIDSGCIGSYDEDLSLRTSGTNRITISNTNGNVDIVSGDIAIHGKHAFRGNDGWLRLNQDGAFPNGVHTPGLLIPNSLNIGGAGSWTYDPGAGNVIVKGNVGIGTSTTPTAKLEVSGDIAIHGKHAFRGNDGWLRLNQDGAFPNGVHTPGLLIPNSLNVGGIGSWTTDPGAGNMIVKGNVGIGTDNPTRGKLEINGEYGSVNHSFRYFSHANGNGGPVTETRAYSIYCTGRVAGVQFNAHSDGRIKHVLGKSNSETDLEILNKLEVSDFTYIDSVQKGCKQHKKLVAQQVEKVFPAAISMTTEVIPSVYQRGQSTKYDAERKLLTITTEIAHQFYENEIVRIIDENSVREVQVVSVKDNYSFVINCEKKLEKVFVYGKRVDDFMVLDYDAIAMLNVSATQELTKRTEELLSRIKKVEDENDLQKDVLSSAKDKNIRIKEII